MAPVIICGMHRSGTSLLCRTLEAAGLFTGDVKEHNHEAVFFLTINQWIFEQHNASWDNTYNMRFLNEDLDGYLRTVIDNLLGSTSATSYTGTDPLYQQIFSGKGGMTWGWKDPRNTFTASLWADIFPGARVIHVCRNPVDVADSLRRREHETQARHRAQLAELPPEQLDGSLHFQQSPRLFHLGEGILLWEEYVAEALALEQQFGTHAIRVRYEDFLAEPVSQLARLVEFAGLDAGEDQLQAAVAQVNPQRRNAFMHDEELLSVYHDCRHRDLVKALGYDRLDDDACNTAA